MATHSSILAWRNPGMGDPGGLPSMGSHRVGHDGSDLAAAVAESLTSCRSCSQLGEPSGEPGCTLSACGPADEPSGLLTGCSALRYSQDWG